ncbi:hypothetical protein OpiT1DRAFT_01277 [Opitutaceae bacterium TAV1]|nr:hypothetical protein OpiT1DRAFT_01277 [Opitutaceae bacterium TAV1]
MRIRTIKPEFYKHEDIAALHPLTRILFTGLWSMADCAGRLEDRPRRIKVEVLPYDDHDVDAALDDLASAGFIVRYSVDGVSIIQVVNFEKHQRLSGKEADHASELPPPPCPPRKQQQGSNGEASGKHPECDRETTGNHSGSTREKSGSNGEAPGIPGKEGKGKEGKGYRAPASADAPPTPSTSLPGLDETTPPASPPPPPSPRRRDPLFDALAAVDGSDPAQLTKPAARAVGVALADIRRVAPGLTPDEIDRRAANYRLHMPDVTLSASALAKWWARCASPPSQPTRPPGGNPFQMPKSDHSQGF